MLFFENHFNKHHLLHAPHLWFFALLSSPIHFAELHYKKRYRLNFEHAKKLFVFDLALLASIIVLISAVVFWFTYNPGVANLVYLSIKPSSPRVLSGEYITYNIDYKNAGPTTLISSKLKLSFPIGFVLDKTEPQDNFQNFTFSLPDIKSQTEDSVTVSGWIYGTPNKNEEITATLSFIQEKRQVEEEKSTLLIKTLRGSVLESKISAPRFIPLGRNAAVTLTLKNNGARPLTQISIPLNQPRQTRVSAGQAENIFPTSASASLGLVENNIWKIEYLEPGASAEIKMEVRSDAENHPQKLTLAFTPSVRVNKTDLPQGEVKQEFIVAYPKAELSLAWQNQINYALPEDTTVLRVNVKNAGNINLANVEISAALPPALVDAGRLANLNLGQVKNQTWKITGAELPALKLLKTNEEATYNLQIPIAYLPQGGTDLTFTPTISISAAQEDAPANIFTAEAEAPLIKIGTRALIEPEARYFTKEGDQLGRGPLPPQAGKETKYWIFIPIINSTSKIKDLKLSIYLPEYINWTGKSSVSHGVNPVFDAKEKKVSWNLGALAPHTQAGVYFEVGLTPTPEQIGLTPLLVKNIIFSATDAYINTPINKSLDGLDSSLPADNQARAKGVAVE